MDSGLIIEGAGISIRPFEMGDAENLLEIHNTNRSAFAPFMPLRPEEYFTLAGQRAQIEVDGRRAEDDQGYAYAVVWGSALVGRMALNNVVRGAWHSANVGYWIDTRVQGRGLATAALRLLVREAFQELGLHRVQAAIMPKNMPSLRVVKKVGFIYEGLGRYYLNIYGVWEDHEIWSLTPELWRDDLSGNIL